MFVCIVLHDTNRSQDLSYYFYATGRKRWYTHTYISEPSIELDFALSKFVGVEQQRSTYTTVSTTN